MTGGFLGGGAIRVDPFDVAIMFFFAALDAAAYAADRIISRMWPHGARVRRMRLTEWY